jgi:hypothetical protein
MRTLVVPTGSSAPVQARVGEQDVELAGVLDSLGYAARSQSSDLPCSSVS